MLIAVVIGLQPGSAQQKVPFSGTIPLAPLGLAARPLPDKPVELDTAEGQNIRVVVVTRALEYPWSLAFLPDGSMLVTERAGRLRIIRNGVLDPQPIAGAPASYWAGESGLPGAVHGFMDVALHPRFAENHFVYLTYTKPLDEKRRTVAIARGRFDGHALTDVRDIFVADAAGTSRIAFGRDGTLFMTTTGNNPQDPNTQGGKVLRLNDDGSIPSDNPFVGRAGHKPEVYTLGHRSSLGLAMHPGTGEMWLNENGPNGGDEINILKPGANYGWPLVSYGRDLSRARGSRNARRTRASSRRSCTGCRRSRSPAWRSTPATLPEVEGRRLRRLAPYRRDSRHRPPRAHPVQREDGGAAPRVAARDLRQRIRDVRQGPDGLLYLLTDEKEGAVLRIEP